VHVLALTIESGSVLISYATIRLSRQTLLHRIGCLVTESKDGSPVLKLSFPLVFLRFCCCSSFAFHVSRGRGAHNYPARSGGKDSRYSLPEQLANAAKTCFFSACAIWREEIAVCSCDMPETHLTSRAGAEEGGKQLSITQHENSHRITWERELLCPPYSGQ